MVIFQFAKHWKSYNSGESVALSTSDADQYVSNGLGKIVRPLDKEEVAGKKTSVMDKAVKK